MQELYEYRQRLFERLEAAGGDLEKALRDFPGHLAHQPVLPQGWSAHQTAAHLREVEAVIFLPRFFEILAGAQPQVREFFSSEREELDYRKDEALDSILTGYQRLRRREAALLIPLPPDAWSQTAYHRAAGRRTLQWWVERSLAHAEEHIQRLGQKPV